MDGNERLEPELDELELAVLRGQQPIWKELYEEHLNDDARKRVRHAVRKGQALEHPFEAALAAGRAHHVDRGAVGVYR